MAFSIEELNRLQQLTNQLERGYRSNSILDQCRPHFHLKQRWFLSMDQLEVFYGGAAGGGKQLYTGQTLLYWRRGTYPTFGKVADVRVGDYVVGSDGTPTRVLALSHPEIRRFYRIEFDDGDSLLASDNHRWTIFDLSRRAPGEKERGNYFETVTTEWLYHQSLKYRDQNRFAIPILSDGIDGPSIEPELSPYLIGYWLGNGISSGSGMVCHTEDEEELRQILSKEFERELNIRHYCEGSNRAFIETTGLIEKLRKINWPRYQDRNKNWRFNKSKIPVPWRLWSKQNRLAFAQGLMDAGGHANQRGDYEFDNTRKVITKTLREVLQSLSLKPSGIRVKHGRVNEKPLYRICGTSEVPIFRLTRKLDRLDRSRRSNRQYRRYITAVKAVGDKEGICFKVAADDGLYAVGKNYIISHNSDALLAAALQYIDIPNYAAILFRNSFSDLTLAGALMDRANHWLDGLLIKKDGGRRWEHPDGGSIEFGYMAVDGDQMRYKSAEFQAICFDESSGFPEEHYSYLFSRLRKPAKHCSKCFRDESHAQTAKPKMSCRVCQGTGANPLYLVPLRQRSASNPGGKYGEWVKRYFITQAYLDAEEEEQFSKVWAKRGKCILCAGVGKVEFSKGVVICPVCNGEARTNRYFVPARMEDNPSLDQAGYELSLAQLSEVEQAQLRRGRWDFVSEGNQFRQEWFRYYEWQGQHIRLHKPEGSRLIIEHNFSVFLTADTASKVKTQNDYTVICAWFVTYPYYDIGLLEVVRKRMITPEILPEILRMQDKWHAQFALIEEASSGIAVIQEAQNTERGKGITILTYQPHSVDKMQRSQDAQLRMRESRIFWPKTKDRTIAECLNELLLFPDSAHDDFVDNVSMAAWYAAGKWRTAGQQKNPGKLYKPGLSFGKFRRY